MWNTHNTATFIVSGTDSVQIRSSAPLMALRSSRTDFKDCPETRIDAFESARSESALRLAAIRLSFFCSYEIKRWSMICARLKLEERRRYKIGLSSPRDPQVNPNQTNKAKYGGVLVPLQRFVAVVTLGATPVSFY